MTSYKYFVHLLSNLIPEKAMRFLNLPKEVFLIINYRFNLNMSDIENDILNINYNE